VVDPQHQIPPFYVMTTNINRRSMRDVVRGTYVGKRGRGTALELKRESWVSASTQIHRFRVSGGMISSSLRDLGDDTPALCWLLVGLVDVL